MTAAILATIFIAYNAILFVICGFKNHTAIFWTSWIFMIIAFAAVTVSAMLLGKKGLILRDWLFGFPIVKHSAIFIIVEFCASTLCIIFEQHLKWGWVFAGQFLFLCVYGICAVSCFISKETIEEINQNTSNKTRVIKLLRVDVEMLIQKCDDDETKTLFRKLAEAIRYSDPVSSESLGDLEEELARTVSECDIAVSEKNYPLAKELCAKAMLQLDQRNKKCKALK